MLILILELISLKRDAEEEEAAQDEGLLVLFEHDKRVLKLSLVLLNI